MRKLIRIVIIAVATVLILLAGLLVWYETTSYRPGSTATDPTLLTGATVLTGPELTPSENLDVLIDNGRITAVAPGLRDTVAAEQIDLTGMTVLPGLIDLHVHLGTELGDGPPGPLDMPGLIADYSRYLPDARRDLLSHGVTTVRDLGNETPFIFELRDGVTAGTLEGPRVIAAGQVFTTAGGHPVQTVHGGDTEASPALTPETPEQAREEVRRIADEGADLIKVIQERGDGQTELDPIPAEILHAIIDEAHHQELKVTAHWGQPEDLHEVLAAGADSLEHVESRGVADGLPPELLEQIVSTGMPVAPTMVVAAESYPVEVMDQLKNQIGALRTAGVTLVAGSDAGMPGVGFGSGLHRELANLVEIGMSPTEALQAATSQAAAALDRPEIGEIREGAVADLIAVEGRPQVDITEISQVKLVLREGRVVVDDRD